VINIDMRLIQEEVPSLVTLSLIAAPNFPKPNSQFAPVSDGSGDVLPGLLSSSKK